MTGAEVGTFLGSRFNERCGVRSVRPNHRATTVNYHEADCNPLERSGPVFNGSVDSWVALAIPTPRLQPESVFHIPTYIAALHWRAAPHSGKGAAPDGETPRRRSLLGLAAAGHS